MRHPAPIVDITPPPPSRIYNTRPAAGPVCLDASLLRQGYAGQADFQFPVKLSLLRTGSPANALPALVLLTICFLFFSSAAFADTRPDADTLWKRAEKQAKSGDSRSAARTYAEFADRFHQDKRYSPALLKKGECERAAGDTEAALKTWNEMTSDAATLNRCPDIAAAALVNIITCHTDAGQDALADGYRRSLLCRFPTARVTIGLMAQEGNAAFMAGDFTLAARRWGSVPVGLLPKRERSLLRLAVLTRSTATADQQRLLRVTASLAAAEPETALPLYTLLAKAAGDTGKRAALARCRLLINLKQPASAESALEAFIKRHPRDAGAWLELGRLQAFTFNKSSAGTRALETAARSSSPIGVEARYLLCGVLVNKGLWKEAVSALEKFQSDFPDSRFADAADMSLKTCRKRVTKAAPVAGTLAAMAQQKKLSHNQMLDKAAAAFASDRFNDANKLYKALLQDPDFREEFPLCSLRLALCQLEKGRENEGLAGLDQTARLYPDTPQAGEALFTAATIYLENHQDFNSAGSRCQWLVEKYPKHPLRKKAELMLAKILICQNRLPQAAALLERLDKENPQPENAPPDEIRRLLAVCQGDSPVRDGLTLIREPANQAQLRLADTWFAAREYAKAVQLYHKSARHAPGIYAPAYAVLQEARCLNQMGEYKDALSLYKQFTQRYKSSQLAPQALLRAGVMQVGPLHNQSAGEKIFETIVDNYPNAPAAQTAAVYLATLTFWDEDYKKALEEYEAYLKRWPDGRRAVYVKKTIQSLKEKLQES